MVSILLGSDVAKPKNKKVGMLIKATDRFYLQKIYG